ncbi:cobaltochelatase subunit CobN [Solirubrobacter sp. CPCC 204708]|uniref:Cobaltochelatase subunit CobN n=1 Tax=Solirubrobacter deserti TaxID=2282478 RepID=A0ABT4RE28_9ACTN|nr:cobaltochelatase subunit CobN [Solirubrobacter deserti]MBE2316034.1 cobaltochelatase subunit CobN [Solirubrobacter deserti]MDA0136786.1 cobaltochelatase subunit CobN [Solirubrobacter deserti]
MLRLLTTADTEILAAAHALRQLDDDFPEVRCANPSTLEDVESFAAGARVVVVRLLGGRRAWPEGVAALRETAERNGIALILLGGEAEPDAELAELSLAPAGAVAQAFEYLRHGGVDNTRELLTFLADTFALTGYGFEDPQPLEDVGFYPSKPARDGRPRVGVVFYRSHFATGNTAFVDALARAIEDAGGQPVPVWTYSLRGDSPALKLLDGEIDALITTVLASGGSHAGDEWHAEALEALDVPVIQALCATTTRQRWAESDGGLTPLDAAMQVAIPEFDGRIIGVPISFKEPIPDAPFEALHYAPDLERCGRLARLAVNHARLRALDRAQQRTGIVLSSFPTKHARIGNAVGLDTPASAMVLLEALRDAGHTVEHDYEDSDALIHALIATGGHDQEFLSDHQLAQATARLPVAEYAEWFNTLPDELTQPILDTWGPPPGEHYTDGDDFVIAVLELGNVILAIQPPRGYGENPVAIYHDPALAPAHHYLATYRWLTQRVDAIVHLGKHGTLEWLPGKALGLSEACAPDACLGDTPLFYPFVVNDPGEGMQAKRRAHAVVIDHLVPPMMRAETYDELARLEQLLDDYARAEALDPAKLPTLANRIWSLLHEAELHRDLEIEGEQPELDDFGDLIEHVDGYLCEIKDLQVRDGLHVLGVPPEGEQLEGLVNAILRLSPDAREEATEKILASTREIDALIGGLHGRHVIAGPSGSPTRGRLDVLPTGRNMYSVDPRALPSDLAYETGTKLADALLASHDELPETVGIVVWGTAAMRTAGDDAGEILALLGVRPRWHEETRRIIGLDVIPLEELGRPRIDVTVRISGFFRDAFPHLVDVLDDAVTLVAGLDEPVEMNFVRKHVLADVEELAGDWKAATARIFGGRPGTYGTGILQLVDVKNWRDDADLAEVYEAWGGHAYGRGRGGAEARSAMRRQFARIDVAVKNIDTREHDLLDSSDYFAEHGGMIAYVRHLAGADPRAVIGDSSNPAEPASRTLAEEARRVFRSRVANPRWIGSMMRHGYKGAFELSATVDYLFGYDATTGVVEDWMYEQVTEKYVGAEEVRDFLVRSNPWALRAIAERLLEAADRGLWEAPSADALDTLREAYLDVEGDLEEASA